MKAEHLLVDDILVFDGPNYPDMRVVAVIQDAIALERNDEQLGEIKWYSKKYINAMLEGDWHVKD